MEINLGVVLASIINFLILLAILKYFFFNKVKAVIDAREKFINDSIKQAEEATKRADALAAENEATMKKIRMESRRITEEEKKKAEKIYDEIVGEARDEANAIKERARLDINRQREKAENSMKKKSVDIAVELAKKLIEKNIDEEENKELIDDFISEVGK